MNGLSQLHPARTFERTVARCTPLVPFVPFVAHRLYPAHGSLYEIDFLLPFNGSLLRTGTGACPYDERLIAVVSRSYL